MKTVIISAIGGIVLLTAILTWGSVMRTGMYTSRGYMQYVVATANAPPHTIWVRPTQPSVMQFPNAEVR
jgi:hypothetical protein